MRNESEMEAHHIAYALAIAIEAIARLQDPDFKDTQIVLQQIFPSWCLKASASQPELAEVNSGILQNDARTLIDGLMQRAAKP